MLLVAGAVAAVAAGAAFAGYARLAEVNLSRGPLSNTVNVYAAPRTILVGDALSAAELAALLRRAGYEEGRRSRIGSYRRAPDALEILPGPDASLEPEPVRIEFYQDKISRILSLRDHTEREEYRLEPELITNVSAAGRQMRRPVNFGAGLSVFPA